MSRGKPKDRSVRGLLKSTASHTILPACTLEGLKIKGKVRLLSVLRACKLSKIMHVYKAMYKSGASKQVSQLLTRQNNTKNS